MYRRRSRLREVMTVPRVSAVCYSGEGFDRKLRRAVVVLASSPPLERGGGPAHIPASLWITLARRLARKLERLRGVHYRAIRCPISPLEGFFSAASLS
jgi:hypothetical protein